MAITIIEQITAVRSSGGVIGPNSSVNGDIAIFNGTTGQLIADSGILASSLSGGPFVPYTGATSSVNLNAQQLTNAALNDPSVTYGGTSVITSSATPAPVGDSKQNLLAITALAANATFAAPSGSATRNNLLVIRIKDDGTSRTLTWNAIYRGGTQIALPASTTISKTLYLLFIYNADDTKWDLIASTGGI